MKLFQLNVFYIFAGLVTVGMAAHFVNQTEKPAQRGPVGTRFDRLTSDVWRYRQPFQRRDLQPVPANNPYSGVQPVRDRP